MSSKAFNPQENKDNIDINMKSNVQSESEEIVKKELDESKKKIFILEKKLKEEEQKNSDLEEKIKILENDKNKLKEENQIIKNQIYSNTDFKQLYEALLKKDKDIENLKQQLARFPFILEEGEKLMHLYITSTEFTIQNYSVICKSSDIFNQIENKVYEKFTDLKDINTYFIYEGKRIDKYKTITENDIKDNGVIMMNKLDDF